MRRWVIFMVLLCAAIGAVLFACVGDTPGTLGNVTWTNVNPVQFSAACGANASSQSLMITNNGDAPVDWTVSLEKGAASPFSVDKTKGTLQPHLSDTIVVTPLAVGADAASTDPNAYTDKLVLHAPPLTDSSVELHLQLSGAALQITPTTIHTGDQPYGGTSPGFPVTFTNAGNQPASFTIATQAPWVIAPTGDQMLAPGASLTAYVTFSPAGMGPVSGVVSIKPKSNVVLCGSLGDLSIDGNGINGAVELAVGTRHVCARRSNGTVACWGNDQAGQLGNGQFKKQDFSFNFASPQEVWLPAPATHIGSGFQFTCAALQPNGVACWGHDNAGQAGNDPPHYAQVEAGVVHDSTNTNQPFNIVVKQISGSAVVGCVRDQTGGIWCWGDNSGAGLGTYGMGLFGADPSALIYMGNTGTSYPLAVPLSGPIYSNDDMVVNGFQVCVNAPAGVKCWSNVVADDAGVPTDASVYTPQPVLDTDGGIVKSVRLGAGDAHFCAVQPNGQVLCWGDQESGKLGDGTTSGWTTRAVSVQGIVDAVAVAGSGNHTCALRRDGTVRCWGSNTEGQLGDGTTNPSLTPVDVKLTEPATSLASCTYGLCDFDCAITVAGHVWCWGANNYLQLGQADGGGPAQSNVPLQVQGL